MKSSLLMTTLVMMSSHAASAEPETEYGIGVSVGGGIAGFTDKAMREVVTSDVAPLWDVRALFGTHTPVGVEVGYTGSAGTTRTFEGDENGTLVASTFEATAHWNILPHAAWNPYVFAGVGWERYDVRGMTMPTLATGLAKSDNVLDVPMGIGVTFHDPQSHFLFDVRGTFRAAAANANLMTEENGAAAGMHAWEASAALGWVL